MTENEEMDKNHTLSDMARLDKSLLSEVVCCQFSREEYNLQKDRLEAVLESMRKWTPA
jgi:hypothetical protein